MPSRPHALPSRVHTNTGPSGSSIAKYLKHADDDFVSPYTGADDTHDTDESCPTEFEIHLTLQSHSRTARTGDRELPCTELPFLERLFLLLAFPKLELPGATGRELFGRRRRQRGETAACPSTCARARDG